MNHVKHPHLYTLDQRMMNDEPEPPAHEQPTALQSFIPLATISRQNILPAIDEYRNPKIVKVK
jgi:hypothetical protein